MPTSRAPEIFRIVLPARDLGVARRFYESLLGAKARMVAEGRAYFDCGTVILGIVDHSGEGDAVLGSPSETIYFATPDLEGVRERASTLGCLSKELLHDDPESPMGEIRVRPWGERSFYVHDPSGNSLCFVDPKTTFTGTPEQVGRMRPST